MSRNPQASAGGMPRLMFLHDSRLDRVLPSEPYAVAYTMGVESNGTAPGRRRGLPSERPTAFIIETPAGRFAVLVHELAPDLSQLTLSERQVHQLVVEGCSNAEISRRRNVSKRTIINQLVSIYRKLGVGSRRELKALFCRQDP
jgi:DNA-binding CsgD family transcriptional regulator